MHGLRRVRLLLGMAVAMMLSPMGGAQGQSGSDTDSMWERAKREATAAAQSASAAASETARKAWEATKDGMSKAGTTLARSRPRLGMQQNTVPQKVGIRRSRYRNQSPNKRRRQRVGPGDLQNPVARRCGKNRRMRWGQTPKRLRRSCHRGPSSTATAAPENTRMSDAGQRISGRD